MKVPESLVLPFIHVLAVLGITRYFACSLPSNLQKARAQNLNSALKTDKVLWQLLGQPHLPVTKLTVDILGLKVLLSILFLDPVGGSGNGMDIHSGRLSELYPEVSAGKTN